MSADQDTADKRFRFIPYRKKDLLSWCLQDLGRQPEALAQKVSDFARFGTLLNSVYHHDFRSLVEGLKDSYAALDPDADTRRITVIPHAGKDSGPGFAALLGELLEKANYEVITQADLNQALAESSLFKISLQVDFGDFCEVLLFCRGEARRTEKVSSCFGLIRREIEFVNYDRVVLYLRFRDDYGQQGNAPAGCKAGSTLLKLFQNVPKADLEMLFPNTHVRMRTIDKLLIGVPALISGGIVLTTKLGASLVVLGSLLGFWLGLHQQPVEINEAVIMALLAGAGALGGYLWKQFNTFKNRKLQFMQALMQNLYFKNLDNNAGVFHRLADDAEEEEFKEAMLAYYQLLIAEKGLSRAELDTRIEQRFAAELGCTLDFEIDDALHKLQSLALVQEVDGLLVAVSLEHANRLLNQRWDGYFEPGALA
uniref:TMEM143 family protein n=1 Tax=Marinobacterium profundum TaxID=1714300 RepID=UPI0009EA7DE0|nr:TMEM143 family protein [Marinobacterium profundum]